MFCCPFVPDSLDRPICPTLQNGTIFLKLLRFWLFISLLTKSVCHFFLDCCAVVEVVQGREAVSGVKDARPWIFSTYHREDKLLNGRLHYTSKDGRTAIAHSGGLWRIQPEKDRYLFYWITLKCRIAIPFYSFQGYTNNFCIHKWWLGVPASNRTHLEVRKQNWQWLEGCRRGPCDEMCRRRCFRSVKRNSLRYFLRNNFCAI